MVFRRQCCHYNDSTGGEHMKTEFYTSSPRHKTSPVYPDHLNHWCGGEKQGERQSCYLTCVLLKSSRSYRLSAGFNCDFCVCHNYVISLIYRIMDTKDTVTTADSQWLRWFSYTGCGLDAVRVRVHSFCRQLPGTYRQLFTFCFHFITSVKLNWSQ